MQHFLFHLSSIILSLATVIVAIALAVTVLRLIRRYPFEER